MTRRIGSLTLLALLYSTAVFAQHPCDGTSPTTGTAVAGASVDMIVCHDGKDANGNPTTITGWAVYDNGARSLQPFVAGATLNAQGLRAYTRTFTAPAGGSVHTYEVAAINAGPGGGEAGKSAPFVLTVFLPPTVPSAGVKLRVQ